AGLSPASAEPEAAREKHQNSKQLQPAEQHGDCHDPLCRIRQRAEVTRRADNVAKPRPDVGNRRGGARYGGDEVNTGQADADGRQSEQRKEEKNKARDRGKGFLRQGAAVIARHDNAVRAAALDQSAAQGFNADLDGKDLDAARRRSGAAPSEREKEEGGAAEPSPRAVSDSRVAGSCNDWRDAEGRMAQGGEEGDAAV